MAAAPTAGRRLAAVRAGVAAAAAALVLAACEPGVDVRGNLPEPETVASIQPGVHGRQDVIDMLGSPSTISTFEDKEWYYIGSKTQQFAFLDPEVLERSVLVVSFADGGLVADTKLYTLEDGRVVDPVDRITPTEGRELTILQQFFGNIGRFNTGQAVGGGTSGGGP